MIGDHKAVSIFLMLVPLGVPVAPWSELHRLLGSDLGFLPFECRLYRHGDRGITTMGKPALGRQFNNRFFYEGSSAA